MANIKSKEKNIRKIVKATERNRAIKSRVRKSIKKAKLAIVANNGTAKDLISIARKYINKAVSKGVFHKNNGARKQMRLDAFAKKHKTVAG